VGIRLEGGGREGRGMKRIGKHKAVKRIDET
jgi:hypothetical protein